MATFLVFGELAFLLDDPSRQTFERFVGGNEFELLPGELVASVGDVLVVLTDAAFQLGFPFVVESDATFGGGERVAMLVELLAEFGKFALERTGRGASFGNGFLLRRKLDFDLGLPDIKATNGCL